MKFHTRRRASPVITIVSLIDILTILLIFFIVPTTFKNPQPQVQIVLPELKRAVQKTAKTEPVVLSMGPKGELYLGKDAIDVANVGEAIKKVQAEQKTVALKADEGAPVGKMFEVFDALQVAGVKDLPAFSREKKH